MLGGNHFKKKIEKRARKKDKKKESQQKQQHQHGAADKKPKSFLKGPIVHHNQVSSRDSANDKRNVPFQNKFEEKMYKKEKKIPEKHNVINPAVKNEARRANASSSAQRRNVLKRHGDDDLLNHFKQKLNASTFRLLNEQIYNSPNVIASQILSDKHTFEDYHVGYKQQLLQWPMNPNQIIVECLTGDRRGKFLGNKGKAMPGHIPQNWVVADMGCGDAQIAAALQPKGYTVHSFDFCALNPRVTVADTTKVPLEDASVDICIFSLSLMAVDYELSLFEAFRILKPKRLLKIVEVRSRIPHAKKFAEMVESIGFTLDFQDVAGDYFVVFDFIKNEQDVANKQNLSHEPGDVLLPSMYKKR